MVGAISYSSISCNLLDETIKLCKSSGLGFNLKLDDVNKKLVLNVYNGADRSVNQLVNTPIVISKDRDNALTTEYTKDTTAFKTFVYITGMNDVTTTITLGSEMGLDRREVFLDLSSVSNTDASGTALTTEQYILMLQQSAWEQLKKMVISEMVFCTLNQLCDLVYGTDFKLGDIVTCKDSLVGFEIDLRLNGVTRAYSQEGNSISVDLGDTVPEIYDTIKILSKQNT
jgi:hypothetical protein